MRYFEHIICFVVGIAIIPLLRLTTEKARIDIFKIASIELIIVFLLFLYLTGGLIIGLILSKDRFCINSLLFGLGPMILAGTFMWGWFDKGSDALAVAPLLLAPAVSYIGARVAVNYCRVAQ